jgi:ATP synthase protein I
MGESHKPYRQVGIQAAVTLISAALVYFIDSPSQAVALLWGGFVSVVNGALLVWRMLDRSLATDQDAQRHLWSLYRSSFERFFVVVVLLAVGMGWLKLVPLYVLAGFVLGQVMLVITRLMSAGK